MAAAEGVSITEELTSRLAELVLQAINMEGNDQIANSNHVQGNADNVPQEREVNCPICFEKFDEEHAPRTLRCGHTVCTPCLETILARAAGDRSCPECRRPLKVTAVAHIPVSYTILRLSRALEVTCAAAAAAEAEAEEASDSSALGELCIHHHYPVLWWCSSCKAFQCRSCTHHNDCPERMPAREALVHLKQAQVEEAERTVISLNELKDSFETQQAKVNIAVDHMLENIRQLESKVKKVKQQVLAVEDAEAQVVEASSALRMSRALARAEEVQTAAKVWLEHKNSRPPSPTVSPDDDPIPLEILQQRLFFTKDIYAVLEMEGERRFAQLTLHSDKILMHAYSTTPPPATALLISEKTVGYSSNSQFSAFFNIHVDGRFEGRVIIVLFRPSQTQKGSLFLDTCLNRYGKTYKDLTVYSSIFSSDNTAMKVVQIGKEIEEVPGNQRWYRPEKVQDNYYHRNIYPGLVSGITTKYMPDDDSSTFPSPATFVVHLYHSKGTNDPAGFGKVISGLGVLRYAMWDKRETVIGDCGIVLPLYNVK